MENKKWESFEQKDLNDKKKNKAEGRSIIGGANLEFVLKNEKQMIVSKQFESEIK